MKASFAKTVVLLAVVAAGPAIAAAAPPRVTMVLVTEDGLPVTGTRDWYQALVNNQVSDLQIRSMGPGDKPDIKVRGSEADPIYDVVGVITARNELVVPGGRFAAHDKESLRNWLTKLRNEGPARAGGGARLAFGLTPEQLVKVNDDLARKVDFATKGLSGRAVLDKIGRQLKQPLVADATVATKVGASGPLGDELEGLSAGTVLACVLRSDGLVLVPRVNAQRQPEYAVIEAGPKEVWPAGWPPQKPEPKVLPGLFEMLKAELDDIPLSQLLEVAAERLETPIVLDRAALAKQSIDVTKANVSLPSSQTMYAIILRKTLFQAKLKHELRVDENGKPFIWVTTLR